MGIISYAQNFEDIMLWRALGHVQNGFYIDAGAADPEIRSVTRAFYERGWCGVNIEPVPEFVRRLKEMRPRDVTIAAAVGERRGSGRFFLVSSDRISEMSTLNESTARALQLSAWKVEETEVPVISLGDICRQHVIEPIHFLKVDVEGAERELLLGADFQAFRPWVVLVEATKPMTPEPNYENWEPVLLDSDYRFVWFDGLNRFYVASERFDELSPAFRLPPNVFDEFVVDRPDLREQVALLERTVATLSTALEEARFSCVAAEAQVSQLTRFAAELERLRSQLRWESGPRALRVLLPVARLARHIVCDG